MGRTVAVVLGAAGVGKTSLVKRFVSGSFSAGYEPTLEDLYTKRVYVDGRDFSMEIIDTAGSEPFETMREMYIGVGDCLVVCYSIDSPVSFREARRILEAIWRVRKDSPPVYLVGTKSDLVDRRDISAVKGQELADEVGCLFSEASSFRGSHVDDVFYGLCKSLCAKKKKASCSFFLCRHF
ncbi:MAG: Ras family protein [Amphiamblys sp. WSBS2006]|nr:MAG: Ras family protein [Amphiamblys sp. WSBS2006]